MNIVEKKKKIEKKKQNVNIKTKNIVYLLT